MDHLDIGVEDVPESMLNMYSVEEKSPMTIAMCNMTALLGGCKLNIPELVASLSASWNPSVFATATVRMHNPRCCILLFSTGKVVCTGARSEVSAMQALAKFVRIVRNTYVNALMLNVRIELMTARISVGYPLDLQKISLRNKLTTAFDELFPGLRWYKTITAADPDAPPAASGGAAGGALGTSAPNTNKITWLVFCNGNIVILGSKSRYQLMLIQSEIERVRGERASTPPPPINLHLRSVHAHPPIDLERTHARAGHA